MVSTLQGLPALLQLHLGWLGWCCQLQACCCYRLQQGITWLHQHWQRQQLWESLLLPALLVAHVLAGWGASALHGCHWQTSAAALILLLPCRHGPAASGR
jgi:hypothetical protein